MSSGDLKLPGNYPVVPGAVYDEIKIVKLVREIAMGIKPLDDILEQADIRRVDFDKLVGTEYFKNLLVGEINAWEGATNTAERVKLKSAAMLEEWLPELYARMNDPKEALVSKVKAGELVRDLAGLGARNADINGSKPGDKVSITINLGADIKLSYEKELPAQVIDAVPVVEGNT